MGVYLLNLSPNTTTFTVTNPTTHDSQTFTLAQYQYVAIPPGLVSWRLCRNILPIPMSRTGEIQIPYNGESWTWCSGEIQIGTPVVDTVIEGISKLYCNTVIFSGTTFILDHSSPGQVLRAYLYHNILRGMNTVLHEVYQAFLSLISEYASGKPLSQSILSTVSSLLQQLNDMLQNAKQFENKTSTNYEGVSALQEVYNNLVQIYTSLANSTLSVEELQNLQLPSYSTPEASNIASGYMQFLNNAINTMKSASSQGSSSSSSSSSGSQNSSSLSQSQVLAQIEAGDINSLQSEISEIPQGMISLVDAVIRLYQIYGIPDGTPLSTAVGHLLNDIRDAYYKISNHKQEEVNIQQLSQLLQIYNTLVSNGLAPQSQSASKLSLLVQTSGIVPALPTVLGQSYPGTVYSNFV